MRIRTQIKLFGLCLILSVGCKTNSSDYVNHENENMSGNMSGYAKVNIGVDSCNHRTLVTGKLPIDNSSKANVSHNMVSDHETLGISSLRFHDGFIYFVDQNDSNIKYVDIENASLGAIDHSPVRGRPFDIYVTDDHIILTFEDGSVSVYEAGHDTIVENKHFPVFDHNVITRQSIVEVDDSKIIFSEWGRLRDLNIDTGEIQPVMNRTIDLDQKLRTRPYEIIGQSSVVTERGLIDLCRPVVGIESHDALFVDSGSRHFGHMYIDASRSYLVIDLYIHE